MSNCPSLSVKGEIKSSVECAKSLEHSVSLPKSERMLSLPFVLAAGLALFESPSGVLII